MSDMTGGSAFPQNTSYIAPNGATGNYGPQGGMTLRDYFAAKAMEGLLSTEYYRGMPHRFVAEEAYRAADEMLIERNKNKEQ